MVQNSKQVSQCIERDSRYRNRVMSMEELRMEI